MKKTILLISLFTWVMNAQNYESFFVGNTTNIDTQTTFGICLMGGATEDDNAIQWFLNRANGGDVVVIRTSGGDGYNDYFFNDLGISLNSVETLLINNAAGALDPYVLEKVANAEAIWFAGGNQATYVNYFKDTALMDLLNAHVNEKQAPIGGTSAGMAIMGEFYFDAINGSVTSSQALNNPFGTSVSVGQGTFLQFPFLSNTITDTHYDNPDRKGRHVAFLARIQNITGERAFGIAAEEYVGICIDESGTASVFGEYPSFDDYAYFLQVNCLENFSPELLQDDSPLNWNLNSEAIKVYELPATYSGLNTFDLSTWETGNGGIWQNWWVENGNFNTAVSTPIDCENLSINNPTTIEIEVYPNPFQDSLKWVMQSGIEVKEFQVYDLSGQKRQFSWSANDKIIYLSELPTGLYFLKVTTNLGILTKKIIKR